MNQSDFWRIQDYLGYVCYFGNWILAHSCHFLSQYSWFIKACCYQLETFLDDMKRFNEGPRTLQLKIKKKTQFLSMYTTTFFPQLQPFFNAFIYTQRCSQQLFCSLNYRAQARSRQILGYGPLIPNECGCYPIAISWQPQLVISSATCISWLEVFCEPPSQKHLTAMHA